MSHQRIKKISDTTVALGEGTPGSGDKLALSPIYRNIRAKDQYASLEGAATLYESFKRSVHQYPTENFIGERKMENGRAGPYEFLTFKQVEAKSRNLHSALAKLGLKPKDKVGIYSHNVPEWMMTIQAANRYSLAIVPLYDSLGENAVEYTINHSETGVCFIHENKVKFLLKALPKLKTLKAVVVWGNPSKDVVENISKQGIKAFEFSEFCHSGEANPLEPSPPKPQDTACIMYTSGTTGNPKGVVLTHENIVTAVASLHAYVHQQKIEIARDDSVLSFLTLAHILGRVVEEFAVSCGAKIGYWQGDVKKLTDDVAALKPTLFVAVPRVLERIQQGIQGRLRSQSPVVQFAFQAAYSWKRFWMGWGWSASDASPLLDALMFNTLKKAFGGRVRFVVSGGAPLGRAVEEYCSTVLCCPVFQGYGLTETCGASWVALPKPGNSGTVGPPLACLEFRFQAAKELSYDPNGKPPQGEICIRGPSIFKGYYQDEEKTKEAFDDEGFFHTGDVGELTSSGCLKVIDRIKNMFKLAQGEYIAAEKLENAFQDCSLVEQVWVYGNSYENFLVGVAVPDKGELTKWAKSNGLSSDLKQLCNEPKAQQEVMEQLNATGKGKGLRGFEMLRAVHLEPTEFSVENDLMTPSFKLKRPQLQKHYQKLIDEMYKKAKK
ncbi:hypothetical protein WJX74_009888 [Apatococcus lobatus]|uniref:Long-chain-fatty-acid--CoA ligase n=1 Tax=Apatococcus lobatus TaxID=904363 RepID=A0AAW1QIG8_9CHLO